MAAITGGVPFGGFVSPTDSDDAYPVTDPTFGLGSLRTVNNTTARDAISDLRREQGMMVFSIADQKHYQLKGGTANSNWQEFTVSGASAEFGITGDSGTGFTLQPQEVLGFSGDTTIEVIINNSARTIHIRGKTASSLSETEQSLVTNSFMTENTLMRTSTENFRNRMGVSLDMNTNDIVSGLIDGGGF